VEQRKKGTTPLAVNTRGRLLLTEEEWTVCMKAKAKEKGSSSRASGSSGGGGGRSHG
jgi:hypothetical protein